MDADALHAQMVLGVRRKARLHKTEPVWLVLGHALVLLSQQHVGYAAKYAKYAKPLHTCRKVCKAPLNPTATLHCIVYRA